MSVIPPVAVFDADLPTGLAFIRSLGRAGVPVTAYHSSRSAMARHSRYADRFIESPELEQTDIFVDWLANELRTERIGLIAPTSDALVFNAAIAAERVDSRPCMGHPPVDALLDCLFKHRYADALGRVGFPTPATAAPTSMLDAQTFVDSVGYPVVTKPRTHVCVGRHRGHIISDDTELATLLRPYDLGSCHSAAIALDPDISWPLLQKLIDAPNLEVVSVSGCLGASGEVLALDHCIKRRQWPPGLGIGSLFESTGRQPFTDHAVEAVKAVLGTGIFEFEVLHDPASGEYWGIDLNPRAFGQVALDIARGNDLPLRWYRAVTGTTVDIPEAPEDRPTRWQLGLPLTTDLTIATMVGPDRRASLTELGRTFSSASVGAVSDWRDPLPVLAFSKSFLRHPGGLVRPFLDRR